MLSFIQEGRCVDYTPAVATEAGTPVRLPDGRVGVTKHDIAADALGAAQDYGIFEGPAAEAATWSKGDVLAWDASASAIVKKTLSLDGSADIVLGTAAKAKVDGDLTGLVHLNEGPRNQGVIPQTIVYEFDCETGVDTAKHVLVPATMNPHGLLLMGAYALVTEVFAGSSQDQGIVTIEDEDAAAICTLTPSDAGADALGDMVVGTGKLLGGATGDVAKVVAAGKAVKGYVSQVTAGGSPAGKLKVYLLFMPLV